MMPSGAYIFSPQMDDQNSHAYSTLDHFESTQGDLCGTLQLYFIDEETDEKYTALVRLIEGLETIEFEVQMQGIPLSDDGKVGKEVIAKWSVADFENQSTFYTDSNGLAMQKRILDQRDTFTLVTDAKTSSNYYPINSAIAIRDEEKSLQFTVMNDRSQGGSSL